jgi:cysteine desulfurase
MSPSGVYLDHAATSPLRPEAREAMLKAWEIGANASSVHALGRKAKLILEASRHTLLEVMSALGLGRCVFTSGGTESNHLALSQAHLFDHVIISSNEHDCLYQAVETSELSVTYAPNLRSGYLDLVELDKLLEKGGRPFVCVMLVNNETGIIQPISEIAAKVRAFNGWIHVDAVQALGKINIDFKALGVDSLSFAAHKIGGPQGVGALVYDIDRHVSPKLKGGGQEFGVRSGTENIAGIAGFAAALKAMQLPDMATQLTIEAALKHNGANIIGEDSLRAPGICCFSVPDWTSQLQLIHMDMQGVYVSSGSACSSGKVKSSRVLTKMGFSEIADKALRVSSGWNTTQSDWLRFLDAWQEGYSAFKTRQNTMNNIRINA